MRGQAGCGGLRPAGPTGAVLQTWRLPLPRGSKGREVPGGKGQERVGGSGWAVLNCRCWGCLQIGESEMDRRVGMRGLTGVG